MSRLRLFPIACLLVFVTLAAALLPPLLHAHVHAHGKDEVCEHLGIKLIQTPKAIGDLATGQQDPQLEHCPYCQHHAPHGLPVTLAFERALASVGEVFVPRLFLLAPRPLFAWHMPASRAPPLSLS
ncbi:DUF2946 family protein [uncultured Oxalicibacterium sp.]|uniref:DUF2946 family protein n=1 Tax=uncultured Oxalicibacterium sp. TaxID=1168540 RepID=UPI0025DDBAF5|nr:DUF2946 family protein [uncultured Oxalicibacterium sp.]